MTNRQGRPNTMRELEESLIDTLNTEREQILGSRYPEDLLHEFVDSEIPIYNSDLAELLADDPGLAVIDDPGLVAPDADIWKRIQVAIYERLNQTAHEWLREAQSGAEDESDGEVIAEYRVPTDAELKRLGPGDRIFVKPGGIAPRHRGMATVTKSADRDRSGVPTGFNVTYDDGRLSGWVNIGRVLLEDVAPLPVDERTQPLSVHQQQVIRGAGLNPLYLPYPGIFKERNAPRIAKLPTRAPQSTPRKRPAPRKAKKSSKARKR